MLTPVEAAELDTPAAVEFRDWLKRIGARVMALDCDEHDRIVALTSHFAAACFDVALAATLAERLKDGQGTVAGSGLERYDTPGAQLVRYLARHFGD